MQSVMTAPATAIPSDTEAAFEALYRSSRDDVFAYVVGLLRDRSAAEDVTATAFERAYRRASSFDPRRGTRRSWLFGIARNAALEINFPPQTLDLMQVYGYQPQIAASSVKIPLDDMNSGLTAVVLLKFSAKNFSRFIRNGLVARLSYYDIRQGRNVQQTQTVTLDNRPDTSGGMLADVEVKKNYTIALLAQSLADLTEAARRGEYRRAETLLNVAVSTAYRSYPTMEDNDIRFVLDIVENYRRNLRVYLRDDG